MKAVVIEQIGSGPVVKDVDEPRRQAGQTLIEVAAAPINPIDISTAAGRYPGGSPDTPFVVGREAVGRVLESDSLAPGARVYVAVTLSFGRKPLSVPVSGGSGCP